MSAAVDTRLRGRVNPTHLEAVTQRVNILRGEGLAARYAARTHCDRGHPFSADNTRRRSDGSRQCRTCQLEAQRQYRLRRKARAA